MAILKPTGAASIERIDNIPFTISNVTVVKTLAGKALPPTLGLRQLGAAGVAQGHPLVASSNVYLAYVQPFRLTEGGPATAGQYVVIGGAQGLFESTGGAVPTDNSAESFTRADPEATALPAKISVFEAQQQGAPQQQGARKAGR